MKFLHWEESWVSQVCELWNREIGDVFPMRELLLRQNSLQDPNVWKPGSWVVLNGNEVVGVVISKLWQEKGVRLLGDGIGWIQLLLVDRRYRKQGIGRLLLKKAEESFQGLDLNWIWIGKDPWHYFPGVPGNDIELQNWLRGNGYEFTSIEYDLFSDFRNTSPTHLPNFDSVQFRILENAEEDRLIAFLHSCFPGRWEYEAIQYFEHGGTGREFVIAEKYDKIVGFCRINDDESPLIAQNVYWSPLLQGRVGGIGPLGIDSNERGNGYGLGIVQAGIFMLQQRGIRQVIIDWTQLSDFYGKLGFSIWKTYHSFGKKIIMSSS